MRTHKKQSVIRLVLLGCVFAIWGVVAFHSENSLAQKQTKCPCETFNSCDAKPSPSPKVSPSPTASPKPRKLPLPPILITSRNVYPPPERYINSEALPGLDFGSGTALDSEYNYNIGKANSSGHFQERRLYINDLYERAVSARDHGETSAENFQKIVSILKEKLEGVNQDERAAYQKELAEVEQATVQELQGNIEKALETRTDQLKSEIGKANLENLGDLWDKVEQVLTENLAQAAQLEKLGRDGSNGANRFTEIVSALRKKTGSDCMKKRIAVKTVLGVERLAQLAGLPIEENSLEHCMSRTLIAKAEFRGIQYEAKRCVPLDKVDRSSLAGTWFITISGALSGKGTADVPKAGAGKFSASGTVGGSALISMEGPAELISSSEGCALKITSSMGVGTVAGYTVSMPGVSGLLPISLVDEPCTIKEIELSP